jgi:hypothetical protein
VRSIVLDALHEGDKTMSELEDAVRTRKGTVPHLYQQTYLALKRIGAMKSSTGRFTLSTKDAVGPAVEETSSETPTQLEILPDAPAAATAAAPAPGNGNGNGEAHAGGEGAGGGDPEGGPAS